MNTFLWFTGAVILITLAHFLRVIRWELFISVYEKSDRRRLMRAISVGYILNYFLPFKLGDLGRAYIAGRGMKNGRSLGYSTVIVDRFFDIICVGFIFLILAINRIDGTVSWNMASVYIAMAVAFLIFATIIFYFRAYFKKIIKGFAKIFNNNIETHILQFSWALIWNFKDIFRKISKRKFVISTVAMWGCYLMSYFLFARFLTFAGSLTSWTDVFIMLFAQDGLKDSTSATTFATGAFTGYTLYLTLYLFIPLFLMLLLSFVYPVGNAGLDDKEGYLNLLPHLNSDDKLAFLENYFANNNRDYIANYLKINQGISIIRDMSAGSNATTLLCMDRDKTFYRKYAFGEDGEKLFQQICWIKDNQERISLPEIINQEKTDSYCFYDMPYKTNSVSIFEYVHSVPEEKAWSMIEEVLKSLENSIYKTNVREADREVINQYIENKVSRNIEKIVNAKSLRKLLSYQNVIINGVECKNITSYEKYLSSEYLAKIFASDTYSVIHGDMTMENIICTRDENGNDGFYIIDPNTGNIHDSSFLDYAKMLQSLHGGYEFLMATGDVNVTENHINFMLTKSSSYIRLHNRLNDYFGKKFTRDEMRSIYFHEIVNWLRLMPYKIESDDKKAVLFYAGTLLVIKDVVEMYGDEE